MGGLFERADWSGMLKNAEWNAARFKILDGRCFIHSLILLHGLVLESTELSRRGSGLFHRGFIMKSDFSKTAFGVNGNDLR